MPLNISNTAKNLNFLTHKITLPSGENVTFRPLKPQDVALLAQFFENLSLKTREYYVLPSYDVITAKEMCDTINRYRKLRFIIISNSTKKLIALFEFNFDIPENDIKRFIKYNIQLNTNTDCRMGPCLADDYQNQGVGSMIFPYLLEIARQFEQKRMILWGGVFSTNERAINFYKKCGFKKVGIFNNKDGKKSVDMIIDI